MSVQTVPRSAVAVKPSQADQTARRQIVYFWVPPLPYRDFSFWPGVSALYESRTASVVGIDLNHAQAAVTISALRALAPESVRRVEPFRELGAP
jgi:hypothetical protein